MHTAFNSLNFIFCVSNSYSLATTFINVVDLIFIKNESKGLNSVGLFTPPIGNFPLNLILWMDL